MEINPKKISESTRFALIETAGLYGGYITGLTFSAQKGGVFNGDKLIEKSHGKKDVTLEVKGVSDTAAKGEVFFVDFEGVGFSGQQAKSGVVSMYGIVGKGTGYVSGLTYTANSLKGKGTGFQFTVIVDRKSGSIQGISSVISYGENYEKGEEIPIVGDRGTGGFIYIKDVVDVPGTEIKYTTFAIKQISTRPDDDSVVRDEEEAKLRNFYHIGSKITIDPTQWGEKTNQLPVSFERLDYGSEQDTVSPGVILARASNGGGIYNSVSEQGYNQRDYSSPADTEWNSYYVDNSEGMYGFKDLSNVSQRKYSTFYNALWGSVGEYILNTELVMHDKTTDLYWKFEFHKWTQGGKGGGFSYTRTLISNTAYAETTFTKPDYGTEEDIFSDYLTLKRGNNRGIYNPKELKSYESLGGVTHLWASEPLGYNGLTAKINISFDITVGGELDRVLGEYYLIFRSNAYYGYPNGILTNTDNYTIQKTGEGLYTITLINYDFNIPNYSTWDLQYLDDKQQQVILGQSLEDELFLRGHLWGLDQAPDNGGWSIQLRRLDGSSSEPGFVIFSTNFAGSGPGTGALFTYSNVNITWGNLPSYYQKNIYSSFNPKDIDINYLKENITIDSINSMPWNGWNDYQMVPWEIIHGANPPEMIDKEMVMLDVQDGKFYRIKFTQWTQGGRGGGYSYIRSSISETQEIVATVTDIAYSLVNSNTEPLENQFSLQILFDRYTKQHFVRVTEEDGTVINHDFDGKDFIPSDLPIDTEYAGYQINDVEPGLSKVEFEWSNEISTKDTIAVTPLDDMGSFTLKNYYVQNGKLVIELTNTKTFYWFFGGDPNNPYRVNGGPSNMINGFSYILFNNFAFSDLGLSNSMDISKSLVDVDSGWRIDMKDLTDTNNYATYDVLSVGRNFSVNYQFYYIRFVSGNGFFDLQNNHVFEMKFYPVESKTAVPYFTNFNFDILAYDKLGNRIRETFTIYNEKKTEDGKIDGAIIVSSYHYKEDKETEFPQYYDESYHATIFYRDELMKMTTSDGEYAGFQKNNVIVEIGFPFYQGDGPGDTLKDEDVEGGFSLAAKIYHTKLTQIDATTIKENWVVDNEFNPKILDKSTARNGEVRVSEFSGARHVYFPIEKFVWDGESNIVVIYYMDGQTDRGGWNGAVKALWKDKYEEYLGFSSKTDWEGRVSSTGGKSDLAFTTNDTRGKAASEVKAISES